MRRRHFVFPLLCLILLFAAGCRRGEDTSDPFAVNRAQLVGVWQMDTYTQDDGTHYEFWDENVVFTYKPDGTGVKTVAGKTEYTLTYSFDGKNLYTTAAYPSTGQAQLMHDLCTPESDTITVYSYDEKATIVLKRLESAAAADDSIKTD